MCVCMCLFVCVCVCVCVFADEVVAFHTYKYICIFYKNTPIHSYVVLSSADSSTYIQNHNDTIIKTHAGLLYKYMYLSLYSKGLKRVTQGLRVRGSWRPNINCNILTPLLWPSTLCLSRSPDAQPKVQRPTLLGDSFLYCILSATSLDPNSIGGPEPLRPSMAFLTTSRL